MSRATPMPRPRPAATRPVATARRVAPHALCGLAALALLALVVWMLGPTAALLPWAYLAGVAPWLVWIDAREHRLPNRLVLPGFVAWALGAAGTALADVDAGGGLGAGSLAPAGWHAVAASLIAGGCYALVLGTLAWWGGMGGGDLKLGALLGLALGLVSAPAAMLALPLAFVAGAVVAIGAVAASPKGARRGRSIPFGPWLLLGAGVSLGMAALIPA